MALHGTKALEAWCKNITASYTEFNIVNMTTSWRSGLGFCAIIHHYCPHLIDWDTLDPDDFYNNNKLAFDVAEQHLGIPSLLDPQDMVECELLDKLSILTYLSQYFQAFHSQSVQARVRKLGTLSKSSSNNSDLTDGSGGGSNTGSPRKVPTIGRLSDPCRICQKKVYILERLNITGRIVHRTCFRCGRCGTQLSLAGYYETETGDYCCELCPDEERKEELERTSDDKKSSKDDVCVEVGQTNIKADSVGSIKTDHDSGHSSEVDEDEDGEGHREEDQDLDLGDSEDENRLKNSEELRTLEEKNIIENNATNCTVGEISEICIVKDNESNIITDINIVDDVLVDETTKVTDQEEIITNNLNPVNNNVESFKETKNETESPFDEVMDENSNNFKSLVIDSNKNGEAATDPDIKYPDDMNPFGDEETEEDDQVEIDEVITELASALDDQQIEVIEKPGTPIVPVTPTPQPDTSTNPFGSDLDSDEDSSTPAKEKQEFAQTSQLKFTSPEPSLVVQDLDYQKQLRRSLNPFGDGFSSDENESVGTASPSPSVRSQSRGKKKRRAPLPPSAGASPRNVSLTSVPGSARGSQQFSLRTPSPNRPSISCTTPSGAQLRPASHSYTSAEQAKRIKDENNLNRRSQILESTRNLSVAGSIKSPTLSVGASAGSLGEVDQMITSSTSHSLSDSASLMSTSTTTQSSFANNTYNGSDSFSSHQQTDKTEEGQWRKKKGPAPPRPIPPRRAVKKLHRKAISQELVDIEVKQSGLERQGVKLEKSIRQICDKEDERGENRDSLGPEAEDLIIQLFDLVNEKNELFRRQTELIYMKKDNRLEEQHADLEHQIRVLMSKPDTHKTDEDVRKEEGLIKKLVEVVSSRNEIVDCLEMDRLRELEEDTAIEDHMSNYAAVHPVQEISKKSLAAKFLRIKKKKKNKDTDSEKDIDTSEVPEVTVTQETPPTSQAKKKANKKKKNIIRYASKKLNLSQ